MGFSFPIIPYYRKNRRINRCVAPTQKHQRRCIVSVDKTYKAKDYPRRQTSSENDEPDDQFRQGFFDLLYAYEELSRPSGGKATANEKDMKAFSALGFAGELVNDLGGEARERP